RLVNRGLLSREELEKLVQEAQGSEASIEVRLKRRGIPKHEILFCLSEYYGLPFVEYDEGIIISQQIIRRMDMERLKHALWLPLSVMEGKAEVIACRPESLAVLADIKKTLGVHAVAFRVALPSDLVRIIEHNQDLNPGFPPSAGRTPLAKVRTFLADRRSMLSCYRTSLAKGRTGLAFLRTGISFIAISLVLFRVFGVGYLTIAEGLLFAMGVMMTIDGMKWYQPARRVGKKPLECASTEPTGGTSVLEVSSPGDEPVFTRSPEVSGADKLRQGWSTLSPIMRRRFLASDRTDFAEERTVLACSRTLMARARTGLSFTRTGIAFIGLGIAMLRQFPDGSAWTAVYATLILMGAAMVAEGFYWYLPGRRAGKTSCQAVKRSESKPSIWAAVFPPLIEQRGFKATRTPLPPVKGFASPGIWATTGLALERTLLAERRNVMSRLRTIMARSRTGMAFIRTGMSISAVGLGLLVYFGAGNTVWTIFDALLILAGLLLIADGLYWYLPAENTRKQFPYCYGEMEIAIPDYGIPARSWQKVVFSHDDV
ncbi:MAG TPA: DUF202 domain-containing protein, partial [Nitrospirota bacterium]|nr:DUF202 domain-containing protein [Nitrospirota bacterium]